ncbi:replication protein [Xenorhabdus nematophila]|uniref:replication protein n=1 Tax=Xenorhabdus nematophila TaxID=628 RepID=UPI0032B6FB37
MSNVAYADFGANASSRSARMENQKQGHFALFRSLLSSGWADDTAKLALWVRLLGMAQYKPRRIEFGGVDWDLDTGQLVTKPRLLARKLRDAKGNEKTPKQVRDMLEFFSSEGMLTFSGNRHGTVITISNYTDYQLDVEVTNKPNNYKGSTQYEVTKQVDDFEVTKQVTNQVTNKPSHDVAFSDGQVTKQVTKQVKQSKKLLEQELNTPLTPHKGNEGEVAKPKKRKPAPKINYDDYLNAYNDEVGDRLPHAVEANTKRQRALNKIISKLATPNVDGWRAYVRAFVKMARPFYFGESERGWTADIDFLLRETTLTGVREGKFAGKDDE